MKNKETIEEAAEKYVNSFEFGIAHPRRVCKNAFINGAKWQQERSYSKEEVYNMIIDLLKRKQVGLIINYGEIEEWFKQFKK